MMEYRFVCILFATVLHFTYYGVPNESVSPPFKRLAVVGIRGNFNLFLRNTSEIYNAEYKEIEADEIEKLESKKQETKDENGKLFRKKKVKLVYENQEKKNETKKLSNDKREDKMNVNKKMGKEKSNYAQDERENANNKKQGNEENRTGMQNSEKQDDENLGDQKSRNQKLKQLKDDDKANKKECNENLNLHSDREKLIIRKKQKGKNWKQEKQDDETKQNGEKSDFKEKREKQYRGNKHSIIQNTQPNQCTPIPNDVWANVFSCMMNVMQEDKIEKCLGSGLITSVNENHHLTVATIGPSLKITLQEALFCIRYFQLLWKNKNAVQFMIPVDGRAITLILLNEGGGNFIAYHIYEDPEAIEIQGRENQRQAEIFSVQPRVAGIDDNILKNVMETAIIQLLEAKLDAKNIFEKSKD